MTEPTTHPENGEAPVVDVDVLIVGSGPAGMSTALHLARKNPYWASRMLVVDKAVHPREKLCGGGVTYFGKRVLANLGLSIRPDSFPVREMRLTYRDLGYSIYADPVFQIVDRAEFDHWLVSEAEDLGVVVRQGEAVTDLQVHADHVRVSTVAGEIRAGIVVAADGSLSVVRRRLKMFDPTGRSSKLARAVEAITPEDPIGQPGFRDRVAVFDFSQMSESLQGYCWQFPSYLTDRPVMNRGVLDGRIRSERPVRNLREVLRTALRGESLDLSDFRAKGHPIRYYDGSSPVSQHRVLLAGDAAGVDPLFGEGISLSLAYGEVVADAVVAAFSSQDFGFSDYRRRLHRHWLLWQLPWRTRLARLLYGFDRPVAAALGWRVMSAVVGATKWGKAPPPTIGVDAANNHC